jgi:transcriptional regulator with XRE-family HTH domain
MRAKTKRGINANNIYRLRRIRGYAQKHLATLLADSPKAISKYETGVRNPTLETVALLEIVLGARLSEIYPKLYHVAQELALTRLSKLPPELGRNVRGRLLGKD